jgi:putative transposase
VPFVQHYCHLVWGTKHRDSLIDETVAEKVGKTVRTTCNAHRATLLALGIVPDHMHLAVSIPPSLAVADFVRAVKSKSSLEINQARPVDGLARFGW